MELTADGAGPYKHFFTGQEPSPGFDPRSVRVEESGDKTGPWVLYAHGTLTPDADPDHPAARSFTAPGASIAAGWNRVVFIDADGNEEPSRPIYVGATWKPSTRDIARLLRARLYAQGGRISDFLNETDPDGPTDPTRDEVLGLIDDAASDINSKVALVVPDGSASVAQNVTALGAALLIEIGSEDFDQERYDRLKDLYDTRLTQLLDAAQDEQTGGEVGDADDRVLATGSFPPAGHSWDRVEGAEHTWDAIGKTGLGTFEC